MLCLNAATGKSAYAMDLLLNLAVEVNPQAAVQLVNLGVDFTKRSPGQQRDAACVAAACGNVYLLQTMLEYRKIALRTALEQGKMVTVERLSRGKMGFDQPLGPSNQHSTTTATPLSCAVESSQARAVEWLLEQGCALPWNLLPTTCEMLVSEGRRNLAEQMYEALLSYLRQNQNRNLQDVVYLCLALEKIYGLTEAGAGAEKAEELRGTFDLKSTVRRAVSLVSTPSHADWDRLYALLRVTRVRDDVTLGSVLGILLQDWRCLRTHAIAKWLHSQLDARTLHAGLLHVPTAVWRTLFNTARTVAAANCLGCDRQGGPSACSFAASFVTLLRPTLDSPALRRSLSAHLDQQKFFRDFCEYISTATNSVVLPLQQALRHCWPELFQCGICFEAAQPPQLVLAIVNTGGEHFTKRLCGHKFCKDCLWSFVMHEVESGNVNIRCPAVGCEHILYGDDVMRLNKAAGVKFKALNREIHVQRLKELDVEGIPQSILNELRVCPSCRVVLQRSAGCDSMRCVCGVSFSYPSAPTVLSVIARHQAKLTT
eukprot:m.213473 g.213473  ORF g.213473 m.213473 type:complete len:542 (-) comp22171_c1_seq3:77-1702(-)